jgi:hypothetical protein
VTHSLCLLTAALLTAQTPSAWQMQSAPAPAAAPVTGYSYGSPSAGWQPAPAYEAPPERHGLLSRLAHRVRGWFQEDEPSSPAPIQGPWPAPVIYPKAKAAPAGEIIEEQSAPAGPVEREPPLNRRPVRLSAPAPVAVSDVQGLAPGASLGNADRTPGTRILDEPLPPGEQVIEKGSPTLPARAGHDAQYHRVTGRLAFLPSGGGTWMVRYADSDTDRYGGLLELSTSASMDGLHSGDLVTVEGEIVNSSTAEDAQAPLFRAHTVCLVEHVQ